MKIYIRKFGADAEGDYNEQTKKVTILAGSILAIDLTITPPSNIKQNYDLARQIYKEGGMEKAPSGMFQVLRDIPDQSPSGSSVIVTGRVGSGWKVWRLEDGMLLDCVRIRNSGSPAFNQELAEGGTSEAVPLKGGTTIHVESGQGHGCVANCQNPCSLAIWVPCALNFWNRVWGIRAAKVNQFPDFAGSSTYIWKLWIRRAYRQTLARTAAPSGLNWAASQATLGAMSDVLFNFYGNLYSTGAAITPQNWQCLLKDLNAIAAARQSGLFWGDNGGIAVYGRSQKLASLIGKYLMVTLMLRNALSLAEQMFLNNIIGTLPAVVDRVGTLDHLSRHGIRVFRKNGCLRSWLFELFWEDYQEIQDNVQALVDGKCCRSRAVYELCHIW